MARTPRKQLEPIQYKAIAMIINKDVNGMTNAQIAEHLNIDPGTLYNWRNTQLFNDELIKQAEEVQRHYLAETYNVLRGIIGSSTAKDSTKLKGIELMLKNQGRLKEVREDTITMDKPDVDKMLEELDDM